MAAGITAALLGGAFDIGSSFLGGIFNRQSALQQYKYQTALNTQAYYQSAKMQKAQNQFNYQTFQESNEFNREMFNRSAALAASAHQIEMNDFKQAGLNPILTATGGNGANVVSPVQSASTSSGSSTMSGGSAAAFNRQFRADNFWRGLQYALDNKMNKSNVDLNESQEKLNIYNSDKAHEEAAYTNEQNRQFQEFNPKIQNAILANYDAQTAKTLTDTLNSVKLLDSQLQVNAAQAWRLRHQALGYSTSSSESKDYTPLQYGISGLGFSYHGNTNNYTHEKYSRSYSRSY